MDNDNFWFGVIVGMVVTAISLGPYVGWVQ